MPTPKPGRPPTQDYRRRALTLLAGCPDGCTESFMLAHGFTVPLMVELVRWGLASTTATPQQAGREMIEVAVVRITDEGQRALTARP